MGLSVCLCVSLCVTVCCGCLSLSKWVSLWLCEWLCVWVTSENSFDPAAYTAVIAVEKQTVHFDILTLWHRFDFNFSGSRMGAFTLIFIRTTSISTRTLDLAKKKTPLQPSSTRLSKANHRPYTKNLRAPHQLFIHASYRYRNMRLSLFFQKSQQRDLTPDAVRALCRPWFFIVKSDNFNYLIQFHHHIDQVRIWLSSETM